MIKNIVFYTNCHGTIIKNMLEKHISTKDKINIKIFYNYENLHKKKIDNLHRKILSECDIFIYQPFNKNYIYTEYNISNVKKLLKKNTLVIKINYYRFRAFWYNCNYIPFQKFEKYNFQKQYGLHNSFVNFKNINNKNLINQKINNIDISKNVILKIFNQDLEKLKFIDKNSDVNMYDFFINNYKKYRLFHDQFHPTNIFIYEIFRQLVKIIFNFILIENDTIFLSSLGLNDELTHWSIPILPIIMKNLDLKFKDETIIYSSSYFPTYCRLDIYEYYYIRLSKNNFKEYLLSHKKNILEK
jgi:hypothetical protein